MGDLDLGGSLAFLGIDSLCKQVHNENTGTGSVLKLLRTDDSLGFEFPHFLRKSELALSLLDRKQNRRIKHNCFDWYLFAMFFHYDCSMGTYFFEVFIAKQI